MNPFEFCESFEQITKCEVVLGTTSTPISVPICGGKWGKVHLFPEPYPQDSHFNTWAQLNDWIIISEICFSQILCLCDI